MYIICRVCGDRFKLPQETVELLEEGYISRDQIEDTCNECMGYYEPQEPDQFSDADPGL